MTLNTGILVVGPINTTMADLVIKNTLALSSPIVPIARPQFELNIVRIILSFKSLVA